MSAATSTVDPSAGTAVAVRSPAQIAARRFFRRPAGWIGMTLLTLFVLSAIFAPLVAPHDPLELFRGQELQPPSGEFWLGTDHLGRDLFSRIVFGSRVTLIVGMVAVALGGIVGSLSGLVAGYFGGVTDSIVMRLWDAVFAFPAILLAIAFAAVAGPSATNAGIALGVAAMPTFARIARSVALGERNREYIEAAEAMGASHLRTLGRHILPNAFGPLLVQLTVAMAVAALLEAGLSFLGLGTQPPDPSWGVMLADSQIYLREAPWFSVFPGLAVTLFALGLFLTSDALRDALDPGGSR